MDQTRLFNLLAWVAAGASSVLSSPIGRVVIAPGTAEAWDDCCDGQLHVRVMRVAPRYNGRPAWDKTCTLLDYEVTLALGVTRCAAVVDDSGNAPSADAVSTDASHEVQDMAELLDFLLCTQFPLIEGSPHVIRWQPKPVQGGCHGGEWEFMVRMPTLRPLPPETP